MVVFVVLILLSLNLLRVLAIADGRWRDQRTHQAALLPLVCCAGHGGVVAVVDGVPERAVDHGVWLADQGFEPLSCRVRGIDVHLKDRWGVDHSSVSFGSSVLALGY